jgi:hypothetical protein
LIGKMTKRSSLGLSMGSSFGAATGAPERSIVGGAGAATIAFSCGLAAEFLRLRDPLPFSFLLTEGEREGALVTTDDGIISTTASGAKETAAGVSILAGITVLEGEKEGSIWRTFGSWAAAGQFLRGNPLECSLHGCLL